MDSRQIIEIARENAERTREFRRRIHSLPELSFNEEQTARYIEDILSGEGIFHRRIAGTGVLAEIKGGSGNPHDAVVLRADIDALPICEQTGVEFSSRNKGIMHACGHDIHTAALIGALIILNRFKEELSGTVLGLFQPGEELCPGGASIVLSENPFDVYNIKAVIGEHVEPELPVGTVGFRAGKYMASSDEIRITVKGKGGHAGIPQHLKDPVVAAAAIVTGLQSVTSRNADPTIPTVLSIGKLIADGATNVIPDEAYLEGTLRTFDEAWRSIVKQRIREVATGISEAYGVCAEINITGGYPCVVNDEDVTRRAIEATKEVLGDDKVVELGMRTTSEDFGYYSQRYPAVFFRLGVSGTDKQAGSLHTSTFDPDEKAIEIGAAQLANLALVLLG